MANSNRNGMAGGNLKGHLALLAAYTIFGVNIVLTKDISNSLDLQDATPHRLHPA